MDAITKKHVFAFEEGDGKEPAEDMIRQLDAIGYGFFIPIFFIMVGVGFLLGKVLQGVLTAGAHRLQWKLSTPDVHAGAGRRHLHLARRPRRRGAVEGRSFPAAVVRLSPGM